MTAHGYTRVYYTACRRIRHRRLRSWWNRYQAAVYLAVFLAVLAAVGSIR